MASSESLRALDEMLNNIGESTPQNFSQPEASRSRDQVTNIYEALPSVEQVSDSQFMAELGKLGNELVDEYAQYAAIQSGNVDWMPSDDLNVLPNQGMAPDHELSSGVSVLPSDTAMSDSEFLKDLMAGVNQNEVVDTVRNDAELVEFPFDNTINPIPNQDGLSGSDLLAELTEGTTSIPSVEALSDQSLLAELTEASTSIPSVEALSDQSLLSELGIQSSQPSADLNQMVSEDIVVLELDNPVAVTEAFESQSLNNLTETGVETELDTHQFTADTIDTNSSQQADVDGALAAFSTQDEVLELDPDESAFYAHLADLEQNGVDPEAIKALRSAFEGGVKPTSLQAIGSGLLAKSIELANLPKLVSLARSINHNDEMIAKFSSQLMSNATKSAQEPSPQQDAGNNQTLAQKSGLFSAIGSMFSKGTKSVVTKNQSLQPMQILSLMDSFAEVDQVVSSLSKTVVATSVATMRANAMNDKDVHRISASMKDDEADALKEKLISGMKKLSVKTDQILATAKTQEDVEFIKTNLTERLAALRKNIDENLAGVAFDEKTTVSERIGSVMDNISRKVEAMVQRLVSSLLAGLNLQSNSAKTKAPTLS